jgi:hypothetical protein
MIKRLLVGGGALALLGFLSGCETLYKGPPIKGMRFNDVYPQSRLPHGGLDLGNRLGEKVHAWAVPGFVDTDLSILH